MHLYHERHAYRQHQPTGCATHDRAFEDLIGQLQPHLGSERKRVRHSKVTSQRMMIAALKKDVCRFSMLRYLALLCIYMLYLLIYIHISLKTKQWFNKQNNLLTPVLMTFINLPGKAEKTSIQTCLIYNRTSGKSPHQQSVEDIYIYVYFCHQNFLHSMVFDLGTNLKLASEVTEEMHVVSCVSFSRPGPI